MLNHSIYTQLHEVYLLVVHLTRVDLQDLHSCIFIGQGKFDLPVESSRAHEGGIEYIGSVGGADDLNIVVGGESA